MIIIIYNTAIWSLFSSLFYIDCNEAILSCHLYYKANEIYLTSFITNTKIFCMYGCKCWWIVTVIKKHILKLSFWKKSFICGLKTSFDATSLHIPFCSFSFSPSSNIIGKEYKKRKECTKSDNLGLTKLLLSFKRQFDFSIAFD